MKVAIITDLHFGARNDNISFLDYYEKFYSKTFFPTLEEHGITTILNLGDTFDRRKFINFNTLKRSREMFFDPIRDGGYTMHMLAGNHDTYYKNTNEVNSVDLLLKEYDSITVYDDPTEIVIDETKIAFMPWICAENYQDSMTFMQNTQAEICMGHFEIDGFVMHRGVKSHGGLAKKEFEKFDMVFSGHYHHRSNNGQIYYLGNPYELTWSDFNDPRGFHIFDTDTRQLEFIQNPNTMFKRIEYDDTKYDFDEFDVLECQNKYVRVVVAQKTDFYKFDTFLKRVYNNSPLDVKIIEDFSEFTEGELGEEINLEDTMDILNTYIDSVDTNVDKEEVKVFMRTLYNEAVNKTS